MSDNDFKLPMRRAGFGRALLASLGVGVIGCAGTPARLPIVEPGDAAGNRHRIIVATSRAPTADPLQRYGDDRSRTLSIDDVSVWVPQNRQPGAVNYPSREPDSRREFALTSMEPVERRAFVDLLNQRMAEVNEENTVFLFIHGYNVSYASGVYRVAQMAEDFDASAVPVHFSWPSSGRKLGYLYDRDSVQFARDTLTELIALVAQSDADSVFLMGHSMGTLLVMEALRQLSLSGQDAVLRRISPLVLASPDIDVDVFRSQMESLSYRPDPMVVFVANDDGALRLSQSIRGGHPRVGEGVNIAELQEQGIAVIDLSNVDLGAGTQHSAFASSPTLISVMKQAGIAQSSLQDADSANRPSPLEALGDFTTGLLYLPKRVLEPSRED
ncbi:MAG: alpha/beta fold hydrolase [Pseudomonadota bacterium]